MTAKPKNRAGFRHRTRGVRRFLFLTFLAAVALLYGLVGMGLPESWVLRLSDRLSTDDYRVELDDITFSARRGVRVGRFRLLPTATPDHTGSGLVLENAGVRLRWSFGVPSLEWVREIEVRNLVLEDLPERKAGEEGGRFPVMGPLMVRCQNARVMGLPIRNFMALVTSTGEKVEIDRIRCDLSPPRYPTEAVSGEFTFGLPDRSVRGAVNGELNPARIVPLMRRVGLTDVPDIVEEFEFPSEPVALRLRLEYAPSYGVRRVEAVLNAESCLIREVPFISARATLTAEGEESWERLLVEQIVAERPEGNVRGSMLFDLGAHTIEFSANSTVEPRALCDAMEILGDMDWKPWKFGIGTEVTAAGLYASKSSEAATFIEGTVKTPLMQWSRVQMRGVSADFTVCSNSVDIARLSSRMHGGVCNGRIGFDWSGEGSTRFEGEFDLEKARFGSFAAAVLAGRSADDPGIFNARAELSGDFGTNFAARLKGGGKADIRDAPLYRVPLFAGLTDFLARNVPGVDFVLKQNDLSASFTVGDNGVHFSKLNVEGALFSVSGDGSYWFTDYLDIGVKVSLLRQKTWVGRILRAALFPVSKLFELEVTGPVSSPKWKPTTLALRGRRKATEAQRGTIIEGGAEPLAEPDIAADNELDPAGKDEERE